MKIQFEPLGKLKTVIMVIIVMIIQKKERTERKKERKKEKTGMRSMIERCKKNRVRLFFMDHGHSPLSLEQGFSTGVPRHTSVPPDDKSYYKKFISTKLFLPFNTKVCRQTYFTV